MIAPPLFENAAFALFNKPAGMNFHSEGGEAGLVVHAQRLLQTEQFYPVHRLDKMTSGLILLAKSSKSAAALTALFEAREIEKYYLALSLRKPKKKQGWIKGDMFPARRGNWMLGTTMQNPAITRFISAASRPGERAFLVKPYTGKTHQIRVALKSLGAPIAGDLRYAAAEEAKKEERGYLHAYALRFSLDGDPYSFVCVPEEGERFLSPEFHRLLATWKSPWECF